MAEPADADAWAPLDPVPPPAAPPSAPPPAPPGQAPPQWPAPAPAPGPQSAWAPPAPQPHWGPPVAPGWGPPPPPPGYGYGGPVGYGGPPPPQPKGGDARTGPLPLHPMSVGDVLDGAFKIFKANARTILLIVGAIVVPLQLLSAFLVREQVSTGVLNVLRDPTVAENANSSVSLARSGATGLVSIVAATFIAAAVARVVAASYLGDRLGPGAALRIAFRRFPALVAAWFLVHLAEVVGFVFCFVPGLLLMAMFLLTAPAIAIEELGPIAGMRRSWRLVRPRLWGVLGIGLLAGLIAAFVGNLFGGIPSVAGTLLGGSFAWLLVAVGGVLSELVSAPIVAIVATLLYFDARIRHEGFDLQLMARDLDAGAAH